MAYFSYLSTVSAESEITQLIENTKAIASGVLTTVGDILEMCTEFPLNLFLAIGLVGLGLGLVARLKRSIVG